MCNTDPQESSAHCNSAGTQSDGVTTLPTQKGLMLAIKCSSLEVIHITPPTTHWTELGKWPNCVERVTFLIHSVVFVFTSWPPYIQSGWWCLACSIASLCTSALSLVKKARWQDLIREIPLTFLRRKDLVRGRGIMEVGHKEGGEEAS